MVGFLLGDRVGVWVGRREGECVELGGVGFLLGDRVGEIAGFLMGDLVGVLLGAGVGDAEYSTKFGFKESETDVASEEWNLAAFPPLRSSAGTGTVLVEVGTRNGLYKRKPTLRPIDSFTQSVTSTDFVVPIAPLLDEICKCPAIVISRFASDEGHFTKFSAIVSMTLTGGDKRTPVSELQLSEPTVAAMAAGDRQRSCRVVGDDAVHAVSIVSERSARVIVLDSTVDGTLKRKYDADVRL
jgi:hypothetical protein